jgi:predicted nucleic acid-binding protein
MAAQHGVHLFDALYHAVAMQTDAILITADERYYRAAHVNGSIVLLQGWRQSGSL